MCGIGKMMFVLLLTLTRVRGGPDDGGNGARALETVGRSEDDAGMTRLAANGTESHPAVPSKWITLESLRRLFSDIFRGVREAVGEKGGRRVKRSPGPEPGGAVIRTPGYRMREIRSFRSPYLIPHPIVRSYYGRRYGGLRQDDFVGVRSFPGEKYQPVKLRKSDLYRIRSTAVPEANPPTRSVRMFKRMKKKFRAKKKFPGREFAPEVETMRVQTNSDAVRIAKSQYRCKTGTNAMLQTEDGRKVRSKGLAFSETDGRGRKSLLCRAETSEVSRPDDDIVVRNSVTGLNVITTDHDPLKFLDRDGDVNDEFLEIGSKAISVLETGSIKNQSVSSVGTHDKGADSVANANTKFVYDETGARAAIESASQVEGAATFNLTDGQSPLVLTSKQEEVSSIFQNPNASVKEGLDLDESEDVATFINYKKKTDFDVAFRSAFDC